MERHPHTTPTAAIRTLTAALLTCLPLLPAAAAPTSPASPASLVHRFGAPLTAREPASTGQLFRPAGTATVRSYTLDTTDRGGIDYVADGRTLRLTRSSSIPFLTRTRLMLDKRTPVSYPDG